MHGEGDAECVDSRFARLVAHVVDRKVVPFLGAGFSLGAALEGELAAKHEHAREVIGAPALACKLRERFLADAAEMRNIAHLAGLRFDGEEQHCENCLSERQHAAKGASGDDVDARCRGESEEATPCSGRGEAGHCDGCRGGSCQLDLGLAAELVELAFGADEVITALDNLCPWENVGPALAHEALAVLILEGLVGEVITTNFDCLLEAALDRLEDRPERRIWERISELADYTRHGARRATDQHPSLNLFKVNGCLYQANQQGRPAKHLALREADLHDWRKQAWAGDLLRDRVRSSSLLFVGFEGHDPMVRHHVVSVVRGLTGAQREEGDDEQRKEGDDRGDQAELFVSAYEDLAAPQLQMLDARYGPTDGTDEQGDHPGPRAAVRGATANAFTGPRDAEPLRQPAREAGHPYPHEDHRLRADEFMAELMTRSLEHKVLEHYLARDSPLESYLSGVLASPASPLLSRVRKLLREDVTSADARRAAKPGHGRSRLAALLRPTVDVGPTGSARAGGRWGTVASALNGGSRRYRSWYKSPVKLPLALVLLVLVSECSDVELHPDETRTEWLTKPFPGIAVDLAEPVQRRRRLLLADTHGLGADHLLRQLEQPCSLAGSGPGGDAVVVALAAPTLPRLPDRFGPARSQTGAPAAPSTAVLLSDKVVLAGDATGPVGLDAVRRNVAVALSQPRQARDTDVGGDWRRHFPPER